MEALARLLLILIMIAIVINFMKGGKQRVKRWAVAHLTGEDRLAPTPEPKPTSGATTRQWQQV